MRESSLEIVLNAAERHQRELLNQASEYERKGFQAIADETMDKHYLPLKNAIEEVRNAYS